MILESGTRFSLQAHSYTETARTHIKLLTFECTSFAKNFDLTGFNVSDYYRCVKYGTIDIANLFAEILLLSLLFHPIQYSCKFAIGTHLPSINSAQFLWQTTVFINGKPHHTDASYPPHIQTLPRKILLFGSRAKRCGRFPTGSDCSTGCLRSIPACPRANRSTRR
jgi:hypothetical protein